MGGFVADHLSQEVRRGLEENVGDPNQLLAGKIAAQRGAHATAHFDAEAIAKIGHSPDLAPSPRLAPPQLSQSVVDRATALSDIKEGELGSGGRQVHSRI